MASIRRQVADLIRDRDDVFDEDQAHEIINSEAFGALVYRIREHRDATGDTPADVFDALDEDDLKFAADRADNPAAFLAAKIRDL